MTAPYPIPAAPIQCEITIKKSRFITKVQHAAAVEEARKFIASLRSSMPAANHHVYAFRVGFGKTVTEGMSDDGEPTGTAGPPTLAVLRGSGIGDIVLVTTRYFGGAKLGTGGLVRAYTESAQEALRLLQTELKVERRLVGIEMPYSLYDRVQLMIKKHNGAVEEEVFEAQVLVIARFTVTELRVFAEALRELSAGRLTPVTLD